MRTYDVIIPVFWIDWNYFTNNIRTWYDELPIKRLIVGYNNPDNKLFVNLKDYLSQLENVEWIDQRHFKTLGSCLADLMDRVKTKWFIYLHTDVELTPYCFDVMKGDMREKVGIIESERIHFNGKKHNYSSYHFSPRSYSGFQIFRTELIQNIIKKIEDDYIYRNEDLIFQYNCQNMGYEYTKSWAMHIHQSINKEWTFDKKEASEMQYKGLIKYTNPNKITLNACLSALFNHHKIYNLDLIDLVKFIYETNPIWKFIIIKELKNYGIDDITVLVKEYELNNERENINHKK